MRDISIYFISINLVALSFMLIIKSQWIIIIVFIFKKNTTFAI